MRGLFDVGDAVYVDKVKDNPSYPAEFNRFRKTLERDTGLVERIEGDKYVVRIDGKEFSFDEDELGYMGSRWLEAQGHRAMNFKD